MRNPFYVLFLLLPCICLQAQRTQIDSLKEVLLSATHEREKASIYLQIAHSFTWNEPDSMIYYGEKTVELAERCGDDSLLFEALFEITHAHYVTGKSNLGIKAGMRAYALAGKDHKAAWQAKTANALGLLYQNTLRFHESVSFFLQSIDYQRKQGDKVRLATSLNNLANSYLKLKMFDSTFLYRRQAIHLRNEIGDKGMLAESYNDIAETFIATGNLDSAKKYLDEAFAIKSTYNDEEMLAVITMNMGVLFMKKADYIEAIRNFKLAEGFSRNINAYSYLSEIYIRLAECSKKLSKINDAYNYLELHEQYKDSVLNRESQQQINELNETFQSEKKSLEIENLKKEQEKNKVINAEKDLRRNIILLFSLLFIVAIGIYSFLLLKRFRLIRAQKLTIEVQKTIVEQKNKEITDSIHYAKRIQDSLLPQQKSIQKNIDRLNKKL